MKMWTRTKKPSKKKILNMCVLSYRAQSTVLYLKKSDFLKYLLTEHHKKSRKILAESFELSTIFEKNIQNAQRSTMYTLFLSQKLTFVVWI